MPLPPAPKIEMTDRERRRLSEISDYRSTPKGIALRVEIVLGAARGIANRVLARTLERSFLERMDESVDCSMHIHLVLDNYGTHKHPAVKKWLSEHPRY
ncbi:MAG TPA: hypothetical protein VKV17_03660, partial [Bryobacteraceae bacterium]|nr:hypothetical protein [Bryobacteraceae bacterium]